MKFKQLLLTNDWPSILFKFHEIYPDAEHIEEYEKIFENLVQMPPEEMDVSIVITKKIDGDETYFDVSGLYGYLRRKLK